MHLSTNRRGRSAPNRLPTVAAAGILLLGARAASAQTWDGGGPDDLFTDPLNWSADARPVNNGTANLIFSGTSRLTPRVDVDYDVNGITFGPNAGAFVIAPLTSQRLTVRGGGITNNDDGIQRFNTRLTFATNSIVTANTANLDFNSPVDIATHTLTVAGGAVTEMVRATGTGTISKIATGTLNFTDGSVNQYDLTIGAGTVNYNGSIAPNFDPNSTIAASFGTLNFNAGVTLSGAQFARANTGTFTIGTGRRMVIQSGADARFEGSYFTGEDQSYDVRLAGSTLTANGTFGVSDRSRVEVSGGARMDVTSSLIVNTGGSVLITDAGSSFTVPQSQALPFISIGSFSTGSMTFRDRATGTFGNAFVRVGGGTNGVGTLTIAGGAQVSGSNFGVAAEATTSGTLTVSGGASRLTSNSTLDLGRHSGSTATMNVQDGGHVVLNQFAINETGTLNIDGGILSANSIVKRGTLNLIAGRININDDLVVGESLTTTSNIGSNLVLRSGQELGVGANNSIRVPGAGRLVIDGGKLRAGTLVWDGGTIEYRSGSLAITGANGILIGAAGPIGNNVTVGPGSALDVTTSTTVEAHSVLTTAGGSFSTTTLSNGGNLLIESGTASAGTFSNHGGAQALVARNLSVGAGGLTNRAGGRVELAGGTGRITGAGTVQNSGLITGSGTIANTVTNTSVGEIRAEAGKTLGFGGAVSNAGGINLQGGTLDFAQPLTNAGRITGRGMLNVPAGLTNSGQMQFTTGTTDVYGPVTQGASGKVIVSGGGSATFYDAVTNPAGSEFRVSQDSRAVFFGSVTGGAAFIGPGAKYFEAGVSTVGTVQTAGSTVVESAAALSATHFRESALTVNGIVSITAGGGSSGTSGVDSLSLGGSPGAWRGLLDLADHALVVRAGDLAGITDQIKDGLDGSGGITSSLANLRHQLGVIINGSSGDPTYTDFQGIASLAGGEVLVRYTLLGDVNLDGIVSGGDLGRVRQHLGTRGDWSAGDFDYDGRVTVRDMAMVRRNFGMSLPVQAPPAGVPGVVPEPGTLGLLGIAGILYLRRRRR